MEDGCEFRFLMVQRGVQWSDLIYGTNPESFVHNQAVADAMFKGLLDRYGNRSVQVRAMPLMPTLAMLIVEGAHTADNRIYVQLYFVHGPTNALDRPAFVIHYGDPWYDVFRNEFVGMWGSADPWPPKADCPFCHADIKRSVFAEEGKFWAVYNIAPILPGHSLVIPRGHVESVMRLSEEELGQFAVFARRVTKVIWEAFDASRFYWAIQDAEEAGQTVSHLHMYIIPRTSDDLPNEGDWYAKLEQGQAQGIDSKDRLHLTPDQLDHYVSALREAFEDSQTRSP